MYALIVFALIASIIAIASPWKTEACSDASVSLYRNGYTGFEPDHNETPARGYVFFGLLLLSIPVWAVPSKSSLVVLVAAWFLINESVIVLAKTRCPGTVDGKTTTIGPGIFGAYVAAVFSAWAHQLQK